MFKSFKVYLISYLVHLHLLPTVSLPAVRPAEVRRAHRVRRGRGARVRRGHGGAAIAGRRRGRLHQALPDIKKIKLISLRIECSFCYHFNPKKAI